MVSAAVIDRAELVALLRERPQGLNWAQIASRILELGSAKAVRDSLVEATLFGSEDQDARLEEALREVREWEAERLGFWTIADSCYPARVRDIQEAPPFLFSQRLPCQRRCGCLRGGVACGIRQRSSDGRGDQPQAG